MVLLLVTLVTANDKLQQFETTAARLMSRSTRLSGKLEGHNSGQGRPLCARRGHIAES